MTKANHNRVLKGMAIDKLNYLGFGRVYASDSGDNVISIRTEDQQGITRLKAMFDGVGIAGNYVYITLGKKNCKALNLIG